MSRLLEDVLSGSMNGAIRDATRSEPTMARKKVQRITKRELNACFREWKTQGFDGRRIEMEITLGDKQMPLCIYQNRLNYMVIRVKYIRIRIKMHVNL